MQFFPTVGIEAVGLVINAVADATAGEPRTDASGATATGGGFDAVLRSFIEEGRSDYSGRPPGFAAYDERPSAVNDDLRDLVKDELRKRGVPEASSDGLDALAASGMPLTVTAMFNALTGRSRASAPLTEDERTVLKGLLTKLGIDADAQADILAMSDAGNVNGMWKRVSAALAGHNNELGITGEEFAVLLKGLDLSPDNAAFLAGRFAEREGAGFTGGSLGELLAPAEKELADRALAASGAAREMRAAVDEAMRRAKVGERSEPVDDKRGNRFSEQSEALMRNSARRRTGEDDISDSGRDADARNDRRSRHEDAQKFARETVPQSTSPARAANAGETGERPASDAFINALVTGGETASARNPQTAARAEHYSSEIFSQVESGLLQGVRNGAQRLTLQLNPEELGAVTVILSFHQGELKAGIRAERTESAELLAGRLADLKASLEEQGIKVAELDVRASVSDNGFAGTWTGSEEHNLMRDADARDRLLRLARLRREETTADPTDTVSATDRHWTKGSGLHLVA
jgi:flagellar hook-length control protein FliK